MSAAVRFLRALAGDAPVTFQTFSDRDELKVERPDGKLHDPNARILHGPLAQHRGALGALNRKGAGVYVMVNAGNGRGRTAESVVRVRALFIDTDGTPFPTDLPLEPHLVVMSSPGKWHLYWKVNGLELSAFTTLQEALADLYGTDPSVKDPPRVMRLPGFYHRKAEPVMVQLLEAHARPPYNPADIFTAWPPLPERLEHERRAEAEKEAQRSAVLARAAERRANPAHGTEGRTQRLLQAHHDTVAAAGDGTRHDTLLRSARALGGYVAGGVLEPREVIDTLTAAANVCGLPETEAADVIRWGLDKGALKPLEPKSFGAAEPFNASNTAPKDSRQAQGKPYLGFSGSRFSSGPKLGGKPCL